MMPLKRLQQAAELLAKNAGDGGLAAARLTLRCAVILQAESRGLLPQGDAIYDGSYGLHGLREQLRQASQMFGTGRSAWPRVRALSELVYSGSTHPLLEVPRFGGELFRPGPAALEPPTDEVARRLLDLLCPVDEQRSVGVEVLAGPAVRRALQPLLYRGEGSEQVPRQPEEILALRICDPAMGAGSFLVAALRAVTEALFSSVYRYRRIVAGPERTICRLADGLPLEHPAQEVLDMPAKHPEFAERLRALLRRHVIERCLHGVDGDPLAVELAKASLYMETMDRRLPLPFLGHKLRCGNALDGCSFDRLPDPASAAAVHGEAVAALRRIHELRVQRADEREQLYRELIAGNEAIAGLRRALDAACGTGPEEGRFHWELEFPDVFSGPGSGFDALVGAPPSRALGGGKNTYRLFLERSFALCKEGGRLGMVVPGGLCTDKGSQSLRELLLSRGTWTHLYAFHNHRLALPDLPRSHKMAVLTVRKGGSTQEVLARLRLAAGDAPEAGELLADFEALEGYTRLPAERLG